MITIIPSLIALVAFSSPQSQYANAYHLTFVANSYISLERECSLEFVYTLYCDFYYNDNSDMLLTCYDGNLQYNVYSDTGSLEESQNYTKGDLFSSFNITSNTDVSVMYIIDSGYEELAINLYFGDSHTEWLFENYGYYDYYTQELDIEINWFIPCTLTLPNIIQSDGNYYQGYDVGYYDGKQEGLNDGRSQGYQEGYDQAVEDLADYDSTALTIFTGIVSVGLLPVNVFLQILNFEVFGINIGAFVSSLLTVAIIVIVIRMVTGNSGGKKE